MAVPVVAGIAAVYLGDNPTATPLQLREAVLGMSTAGRLTSPYLRSGTPNRLVYSRLSELYAPAKSVVAQSGKP